MSIRSRIIRRNRKNLMKLGKITRVEVLNKDDEGNKYPKNKWRYYVQAKVNTCTILSPDNSWYGAYQGALELARLASEQEEYKK